MFAVEIEGYGEFVGSIIVGTGVGPDSVVIVSVPVIVGIVERGSGGILPE